MSDLNSVAKEIVAGIAALVREKNEAITSAMDYAARLTQVEADLEDSERRHDADIAELKRQRDALAASNSLLMQRSSEERRILAMAKTALSPFAEILGHEDSGEFTEVPEGFLIGQHDDGALLHGDFVTVGDLRKAKESLAALAALEVSP